MQYTRFGNFVANKSTNLSARQSYAVESDTSLAPLMLKTSTVAVLVVGLVALLLWNRK